MKNYSLILSHHIPSHIVFVVLNNIYKKNQKTKSMSSYSYVKIQSCFPSVKQNITSAYEAWINQSQPINQCLAEQSSDLLVS